MQRTRLHECANSGACCCDVTTARCWGDICRTIFWQLAERQQAALAEQQAADRLAQAAQATCDRARNALSVVSQRNLRRGRMADTLRRQEALAALAAEEEAVSDELMERLGAVAVA